MTAREYAKECNIKLVGRLTKKISISKKFDYSKGKMVTEKSIYWIDEIGNELSKENGNWCLITPDGTVY